MTGNTLITSFTWIEICHLGFFYLNNFLNNVYMKTKLQASRNSLFLLTVYSYKASNTTLCLWKDIYLKCVLETD